MPLQPLTNPLPPELQLVERLVEAYGSWAARRGRYTADVHAVRLAMYRLPAHCRAALEVLYVASRTPISERMRRLGLKPSALREHQVEAMTVLRDLVPIVYNARHPDNRGQR